MDDPQIDAASHAHALRGLARMNLLSLSAWILWRPIRRWAQQNHRSRLRVLDVATGAGDIPIRLWRQARQRDLALDILAVDRSPRAVELAQARSAAQQTPIEFAVLDVLQQDLPTGFDVVITSLFLHHLADEDAAEFLGRMARAAGRLVLVNDLRRSYTGELLAWLATRLFTTSEVVRVDAIRSVRAAFTMAEVRALADRAGLQQAKIEQRWPFRFLLQWERR